MRRPLPVVTPLDRLAAGGDDTLAALVKDRRLLDAAHRGDPAFDTASSLWGMTNASGVAAVGSGAVVDLADKAVGSSDVEPNKPHLEPYVRWKDGYKREIGSTW
jgi:hypothetical protein